MAEYQLDGETNIETLPVRKGFLSGIEHIFKKMSGVNLKVEAPQPAEVSMKVLQITAQNEQASELLKAELYDLYFMMVSNGFQPNENHDKLVNRSLHHLISNMHVAPATKSKDPYSKSIETIDGFIKKGYQLTDDVAYKLISGSHFQAGFWKHSISHDPTIKDSVYPDFFQQIRQVIRSDSFSEYAGKAFLGNVIGKTIDRYEPEESKVNMKELHNIPLFLNDIPEIVLGKVPLNNFISFVAAWKELKYDIIDYYESDALMVIKETEKAFQKTLDGFYSQNIAQAMNKTKEIFADEYFQKVAVAQTKTLADNYKVESLPQDTQAILKEVQTQYTALQVHKKTLSEEQNFTIETLFDKRIPEVLQKYFSIDKGYRTTLSNSEGKNAHQLMNESLNNFNQKLVSILEEVNQNKVSDLSATRRYSRNI